MQLGDVAFLQAVDAGKFGAFLAVPDDKDILLPRSEQLGEIVLGDEYLVIICYDAESKKQYASEKIGSHILQTADKSAFTRNQEVEGVIYELSELGAHVVVNKQYKGLLYKTEFKEELYAGDVLKMYIKNVREDGKIDLTLSKVGYLNRIQPATEMIMEKLNAADGFLPFNDSSSPEEIQKEFGLSKTAFKQAIGMLYRQTKIEIMDNGIQIHKEKAFYRSKRQFRK